jgi:hypothetical protein
LVNFRLYTMLIWALIREIWLLWVGCSNVAFFDHKSITADYFASSNNSLFLASDANITNTSTKDPWWMSIWHLALIHINRELSRPPQSEHRSTLRSIFSTVDYCQQSRSNHILKAVTLSPFDSLSIFLSRPGPAHADDGNQLINVVMSRLVVITLLVPWFSGYLS